jgi:hypothetical protein
VTAYTGLTVSAGEAGLLFDSVVIPAVGAGNATASGEAADLNNAARMPSDTAVFIEGYDLGQSTAMKLLGTVLAIAVTQTTGSGSDDAASPTPVSIDDVYEQIDQMLGFNLKTDFFDQLTGPYAVGVWDVDAEVPTFALVSGVEDQFRIGNALGTVSLLIQAGGQGQFDVTSLEVEGGSLDHVEYDDNGTAYEIDYGVVNDEFVVSLNGGAEVVVNGPPESLADSTRFTTALSNLPAEHYAVYYVDLVQAQSTGQDAAGGLIGADSPLSELLGTPVASDATAQSFAAVSYVEDGYAFTSGIIVVP